MSSTQRILAVRDQIREACVAAGRDPATVHLLAVSKTFPAKALEPVYDAGQRHFGENYVQELTAKAASFAEQGIDDITWHFIGRIQSNKTKHIAAHASYVHALEKLSHAKALGAHATRPIKVLLEVNIGGEASKGGVAPHEVLERCEQIREIENLVVCGLMCLPPANPDPEHSAPFYAHMAELAREGQARGLALTELSMGMSHDFPVAIRHEATWVRVGSAIFGARE